MAPERVRRPSKPRKNSNSAQRLRNDREGRGRHLMLKLVLVWSCVLVLVVLGARHLWHRPSADRMAPLVDPDAMQLTELEAELLQEAGQASSRAFAGFIAAGSPEQRNQFVLNPVQTAARMARYYAQNPLPKIDPEKLMLNSSGILRLPGATAWHARWENEDGKTFETVFCKEGDEWRMDWEYFAAYSDFPWALFVAGSGPDEGEFRLLARERLADERIAEPEISLVLYAPRFGSPLEADYQSPEFLIPRNSKIGKILDQAFRIDRQGGRIYEGKLDELIPENMIRLRLKVRRLEDGSERKFEIREVLACHWYGIDDLGVSLDEEVEATESTTSPE
ncbi:MAG: hypothetical protein ACO3RV_02730 [Luteolibacter sp.]